MDPKRFHSLSIEIKIIIDKCQIIIFHFFAFANLAITSRIMYCSVILCFIHSSYIINGLNFNRNPLTYSFSEVTTAQAR